MRKKTKVIEEHFDDCGEDVSQLLFDDENDESFITHNQLRCFDHFSDMWTFTSFMLSPERHCSCILSDDSLPSCNIHITSLPHDQESFHIGECFSLQDMEQALYRVTSFHPVTQQVTRLYRDHVVPCIISFVAFRSDDHPTYVDQAKQFLQYQLQTGGDVLYFTEPGTHVDVLAEHNLLCRGFFGSDQKCWWAIASSSELLAPIVLLQQYDWRQEFLLNQEDNDESIDEWTPRDFPGTHECQLIRDGLFYHTVRQTTGEVTSYYPVYDPSKVAQAQPGPPPHGKGPDPRAPKPRDSNCPGCKNMRATTEWTHTRKIGECRYPCTSPVIWECKACMEGKPRYHSGHSYEAGKCRQAVISTRTSAPRTGQHPRAPRRKATDDPTARLQGSPDGNRTR